MQNPEYTGHSIRFELDTESGSNWTPNPFLTGQRIRFELDTFFRFPDLVSSLFRTKIFIFFPSQSPTMPGKKFRRPW